MDYILEMKGVCKSFPGVKALDNVHLQLREGEVHALLGENGAGKSTLIKILTGIYSIDEGQIFIRGNEVKINHVNDARKYRIAAIHQELCLVPHLTVAQNIFLGRELKKGTQLDNDEMDRQAQELIDRLGLDIKATDKIKDYSIAKQQLVEIAKAISVNAEILIMDEPTSSLSNKEVINLFNTIAMLKSENVSIIYISHRLEELFEISDRVTVLRDGQYIATLNTAETNKDELVSLMVGRQLDDYYIKNSVPTDEVALEVSNLTSTGVFNDISFKIHKGEILGFSGMVGAGRTELARAIFGIDPYDSGEVVIDGNKLEKSSAADSIKKGLALIPENRKEQGLILIQKTSFNITLDVLDKFLKFPKWNQKEENRIVDESIKNLDIRCASSEQLVGFLSGGNQQKVVIAKWLATDPKVLILDEPTRGVDVGAKAEIYAIMNELANRGVAIMMISSELPEIINMSDRVAVMREGELKAIIENNNISQETILSYAV